MGFHSIRRSPDDQTATRWPRVVVAFGLLQRGTRQTKPQCFKPWMCRTLAAFAFVYCLAADQDASADAIYYYEGNSFDTFPNGGYSSDNYVSVEVRLPAPLAPNLVNENFNPFLAHSTASMLISDNYAYVIDSQYDCSLICSSGGQLTFSTDEFGNITEWNAFGNLSVTAQGMVFGVGISTRNQSNSVPAALDGAGHGVAAPGTTAEIENMPGTWTMTLVPEPGVTVSILTGMLWMQFASRRVRARRAPSSQVQPADISTLAHVG